MKPLGALVGPYIGAHAVLGAAVAILQDGEIAYLGGFGTTSVEDGGARVTPRTLFAYGSIGKTICATLTMRLVEKGLLDLDTPAVHYLPDLHFGDADYGSRVTLRHLLSHTSGLPMAGKYWGPRDPDSLRRFVYEQIPYYAFLMEPGTAPLYSNTVICIAGHLAEVVTGKFYDDLVQEYVLDPLQMVQTTFDPAVALTYPVALPHKSDPGGEPQVMHRIAYNVSGNPSGFALGSVSDLANLAQMYLNQGRFGDRRFLTESSIAEMQRLDGDRHVVGADHPMTHICEGYGLGFQVGHYRGKRIVRHGGTNLSYDCFFDLFPDERAAVVLLTNYSDEESLIDLWAALYDRALNLPHQGIAFLDKPAPISMPLHGNRLQHYAGSYLNVETADLARFIVVDGKLMLERGESPIPLVPFGDGQFYGEYSVDRRIPVEFLRDREGETSLVMIWGQPYHPVELDPTFVPDSHLWQSFEGVYKEPSNSNREEILTVCLQDGVLSVTKGNRKGPCKAISNRCFLSDIGLIEFEDTHVDEVKVLVWGKATRYYPLDDHEYHVNNVIRYLVDYPVAQRRTNRT